MSLVWGVFIVGVLTFELIFTVCGFNQSVSQWEVNFAHGSFRNDIKPVRNI
jgi:hypothetical protein